MSDSALMHTAPKVVGSVGLAVIAAVVVGTLVYQSASSSAAASEDVYLATSDTGSGTITEADGVLPDGVTVFDGQYAGISRLNPGLLRALRQAANDADDLTIEVNSGWRSARYQDQLLQEAVAQYGSREEAARWVATPQTSLHVAGDAVDIGPSNAIAYLAADGARYGLCQIYDNEPWHFELRPQAADDGCPARYADPTQDPRLR